MEDAVQYHTNMPGSRWFKRLVRECKKISPHIRFRRIKQGFYRVYWKEAYIHEVYKDMPIKGYDIESYNQRLEDRSYYEEYEDNVDMIRTIKNFVEGYHDSIDKIRTRIYMFKNNDEMYQTAKNAYKQMVVK